MVRRSAPASSRCVAKQCLLCRMRHSEALCRFPDYAASWRARRQSYWFELCRCGIVQLPAWHSGRVINQLFSFSSTIERLRQGPLSEHLDAYAGAVAEQGYAHHSIRQQIVVIADFSRWLKQKQIAVRALDSKVLDRFLRLRCRQHRVRRGDPRALERLLAMLRQTGVVKPHQPPVVDNAQSRIISEFRRYLLHECGRSLRHQSPNTTAIYAKVDVTALHTLALPWPGGGR
jgi:hypothetical protein